MGKNEIIEKVLKTIDKMPPLNPTYAKVIEISNRPNVTAPELNKIISLDPVLTAKVLRLINSAYYGLNTKINTLVRAIIMLGVNTVKNLAISTAILSSIDSKDAFINYNKNFWEHSIGVGIISKLISQKRDVDPQLLESYFVCGLLHDLGKIPLYKSFKDDYIDIFRYVDENKEALFVAEKKVLGVNHSEVGDLIAEAWNLNNEIRDSIAFHHSPENYEEKYKDYVYTVSLANYYTHILDIGYSGDKYPKKPDDKIGAYLGINDSILDEIEPIVENELKKAKVFLTATN